MTGLRTWREATERALYGEAGFYRRPEGPAGHFRTSVHAAPAFARALHRLATEAGVAAVVDLGAGRGELLAALHRLGPDLRLHAVEVAGRPAGLPAALGWSADLEAAVQAVAPGGEPVLLVANEWLDNVPVDVAERTEEGVRLVLVDPATGAEELGPPPTGPDSAWLDRWWPLADAEPGTRAEIGRPRDDAWAATVRALPAGIALAVDYAHARAARPPFGTLAGYREGRAVPPVPDGSCDVTSHVALDACAAAGRDAGAAGTVLTTQRAALRALGVTGTRPALELAGRDPAGYVRTLAAASEEAELLAPGGLGGFGWLLQTVDMAVPASLVP